MNQFGLGFDNSEYVQSDLRLLCGNSESTLIMSWVLGIVAYWMIGNDRVHTSDNIMHRRKSSKWALKSNMDLTRLSIVF